MEGLERRSDRRSSYDRGVVWILKTTSSAEALDQFGNCPCRRRGRRTARGPKRPRHSHWRLKGRAACSESRKRSQPLRPIALYGYGSSSTRCSTLSLIGTCQRNRWQSLIGEHEQLQRRNLTTALWFYPGVFATLLH